MEKFNYKIFETIKELANTFAEELMALSNLNQPVYIALSGGNTPKNIFDILTLNYRDKINWNQLRVFWVDERCVPPDHDESNYLMTKTHLFDKTPISDDNIFRVKGEMNPKDALEEYIEEINNYVPHYDGIPVFDLTILGMGDDGHTASIFPHEISLWHSNNICEIGHHPTTSQSRVTITGKVINQSKKIIVLVTGKNKANKIDDIFNRKKASISYPASLIKQSKCIWYMDNEASSRLKE